jgi:hypothetical protein
VITPPILEDVEFCLFSSAMLTSTARYVDLDRPVLAVETNRGEIVPYHRLNGFRGVLFLVA